MQQAILQTSESSYFTILMLLEVMAEMAERRRSEER